MTSPLRAPGALASWCALAFVTALSGCGGSDDPVAPAAPVPPPPAAASTTVSGAVVKGPVSGAQICAYTVVASARGSALGSCTTSGATGNYSLAVPAGSGSLWIEATGGSYVDEVTQATVAVPAGSPLVSLVAANGASVTAMLTPLTTLALNAARSATATTGTLDATSYAAAATQLMSSFNLPAGLNITTTLPTFGSGINSYGTALTAISQMVANGTTLATILANANPSALAAAYTLAATPPPLGGGGGTGSPSASGSLTVAGTSAPGAATSLTPQADGFEVGINNSAVSYRFYRTTNSPATRVEVTVGVSATGVVSVSYYDLAARSTVNTCNTACGVSITPASGASRPVTVAFANTALSGGITLNGSLVGDAPGAAWSLTDLPAGTTSSLTLNGSPVTALTSSDSTFDAGGGSTIRSIALSLSDGSQLALSKTGSAAFTVSRVQPPATISSCATACNITVTDGNGTRVSFANTSLGGGLVLNGTVDYARTSGTLSTNDTGSFTPTTSNIASLNGTRTLTFSVLGTAAQAGLSLVTLDVAGGRVVRAQATVGIASQVLSCFDNGAGIGIPACTGVSVAADGRTVSFNNAVLRGGAVGAAARDVTFNGTVAAKGF